MESNQPIDAKVVHATIPIMETAYWRGAFIERPYIAAGMSHGDYGPAYQYGWESHARYAGKKFEDVKSDIERGWPQAMGISRLNWDQAQAPIPDAWDRIDARELN
jgi:hypothetical protein